MDNSAVMNKMKEAVQRLDFIVNGTSFEAQIIGAKLHEENTPETDTLQGAKAEEKGKIRVKINYTHPFIGQQVTVECVLSKSEYKDDRLIKIGNPEQATDVKFITHMNHNHLKQNKKKYDSYKHEVTSRKLSAAEKDFLLEEASIAMSTEDVTSMDSEGYTVLMPPVKAEGYLLDCEVIFIQKTNHTCFHEWVEEKH